MRQMSRLNWRRALLGGVLAAVLWGVLYAPVHPLVEVHTTLGRPVLPITPFRGAALLLRVLVVLTGFVQGIATVCLYAAIRPRFGAGPSTAAIAALSVWFLTSWMHLVWAVFTAVPIADALVPLVVNLPLVVLAGLREHGFIENDPSLWSQLSACPAPNMRLKLAGARVGRIALPRWPAFVAAVPPPCAGKRCARSLSAIR